MPSCTQVWSTLKVRCESARYFYIDIPVFKGSPASLRVMGMKTNHPILIDDIYFFTENREEKETNAKNLKM